MLSLRCKMILTNLHFSDFDINSMAHFIPAESLNCSKIQVEVEVQARAHKLPMQRDRPKAGPWPGTEHICPNPRVTSLLHVSILNSICSLQWRFSSWEYPALPHPSLHLHSPQGPLCIARGLILPGETSFGTASHPSPKGEKKCDNRFVNLYRLQ